jgi:hypothetical protein
MAFVNPEVMETAEKAIRARLAEGGDDAEIALERLVIFKVGSEAIANKPKDIAYIGDVTVEEAVYEIYAI